MPIKFTCPQKKITDEFSDAYAGIEFKCKRCGNYHTIPLKADFKRKDLLVTCPITNSILAINPEQPGHEFQCEACKGVHQIPDRSPNPGSPLATSVLFQKQNREAVIPSQRKLSPLQSPLSKPENKNSSNRKQSKTKRDNSNVTLNEILNKPNGGQKKKKPISVLNILIIFIFFLGGIFLYFTITKVSSEKDAQKDLTTLLKEAQANLDHSNFQVAFSIINEILTKIEPQSFQITDFKIKKEYVLKKKDDILACQNTYKSIYDRFAPILTTNNLDLETVLKYESLLKEEISPLRLTLELKPAINLLDQLVIKFKEKAVELDRKMIENIFTIGEKYYNTGNYTEAFYHYSTGLSKIDQQEQKDAIASKDILKVYIKNFDTRINNFAKANDIIKTVQTNSANLDDCIK